MGRKNSGKSASLFGSVGLTLVELLVVSAILGVLVVVGIAALSPSLQLGRGKDARRQEDLGQIRSALDTYYNDKNAYPTTFTFGSSFTDGTVVYMKTVPQDPDGSPSYQYITVDLPVTKPQWAVLFAKLSNATAQCSLTGFSSCTPANFTNRWMCVTLGNIDSNACTVIGGKTLP